MPPLEPEEVWRVMQEQAEEDERADEALAAVLKMSDAELDAELRQAGIDPGDMEARARAFGERAQPLRTRDLVWLAAATSAAVSVAVSVPTATMVASRGTAPSVPTPPPIPAPTASVPAAPPTTLGAPEVATIRRDAFQACDEGRWQECLTALNLARRYDPAGDADPKVTTARREATAGLDLFLRDAEIVPEYPAKR